MTNDDPTLIRSSKSQRILVDGLPFAIEIFRLEHDVDWSLEVIDPEGTSHVWDDSFRSDKSARDEAIRALQVGATAFMSDLGVGQVSLE
ncbi:MAG: hypothetical protein HOY44_03415 [Maritimibacter sp.]|uniref:hypothetical protein n=1 Tax=Maritimibacter sp. TaxID=2003363 RepID=UPI001DE56B9B|nr:hypothetical protein [Maritimibacter sp.]MBL6426561.1 hypothetical protein [Maritimibacter sp.]